MEFILDGSGRLAESFGDIDATPSNWMRTRAENKKASTRVLSGA